MRDVGAGGYEDIITLIGLTSTPRDGAAVWMAARARGRGAMLTFGAKVKDACGLFVGFSDDRRLEVVVRFGVVVFVLGIIIIVGVSRRHYVAHEAPVDQPGGGAWGHVGSCWMSRHSRTDVSARARGRQSVCFARRLSCTSPAQLCHSRVKGPLLGVISTQPHANRTARAGARENVPLAAKYRVEERRLVPCAAGIPWRDARG